ncbi:MAG: hypothetical protein U0133_09255 [Gemmatimonadales bacterium]
MTKCTLCMTEVDPAAVVCRGCGATLELVRQPMGYPKGCLMLAILCLSFPLMLSGRYFAGFICIGLASAMALAQPKKPMWVRRTIHLQ